MLLRFVELEISDLLAKREIEAISRAARQGRWDGETFIVRGSAVSREITATYLKDECSMEVVIRMPTAFPFKNVEVDCRKVIHTLYSVLKTILN